MFTDLECKFSFDMDINFSAYLNIDKQTTGLIIENSVKVLIDFFEAVIINEEYENFNKGYILRFVKSKIRNIKVITKYYQKYIFKGCTFYEELMISISNIEYFFKQLLEEAKKLPKDRKEKVFYNFVFIEFSRIIYLSLKYYNINEEEADRIYKICNEKQYRALDEVSSKSKEKEIDNNSMNED